MLEVTLDAARRLHFDDGAPVRAASAIAPYGDGWLVAQDDAAHAAWVRPGGVERIRVVPSVESNDVFSAAAGTKHLKPDFEAACPVEDGVLLLGSGSTRARMRVALVAEGAHVQVVDLAPLYERVADVLDLALPDLNLEGACRAGDVLRWFARGNLSAGIASRSVDVPLPDLMAALRGGDPSAVDVRTPRTYDLGSVDGVGLSVTDAVALPDGRILLSAAAEDTPNAVDDGPVVASALALLDGDDLLDVVALPHVDAEVAKVEGLAVVDASDAGAHVLAVVDDDDPDVASYELALSVRWG